KRLASASADQTVKVWDTQTGQELSSITRKAAQIHPFVSVTFSPDGKRLASGGKLWDAQTGQELVALKGPVGPFARGGATFSPDGKRLATAGDRQVKVWDAQTGQETLNLKATTGPIGTNVLAFSPDGHRLGIVTALGAATIWDATPLTAAELDRLTPQNM